MILRDQPKQGYFWFKSLETISKIWDETTPDEFPIIWENADIISFLQIRHWRDVSLSLFCFPEGTNRDFSIFCPLVSFYIEILSHQPTTNTAFILSAGNSEFLLNSWKESDFPFSQWHLSLFGIQASPFQWGRPSFFTWTRFTFSSSAKNMWEQPGPGWSKSKPLSIYPVCKACQTWLVDYQTFLWRVPWSGVYLGVNKGSRLGEGAS